MPDRLPTPARRRRLAAALTATALGPALLASACSSSGGTAGSSAGGGSSATAATGGSVPRGTTAGTTPGGGIYVYWDQNEEEEYLRLTDANDAKPNVKVLVPPWDPNGQLCILPDNSGRFVTGYNPTNPDSQGDNPGSKLPFKDPPTGMALWNADGSFSGTTFFVPGPYKNVVQGGGSTNNPDAGGDVPPDKGGQNHFNDNGTFTGCAFGKGGNLFASDLGTAQGDMPPPDTGRVVMWFAPDYARACIVLGPTEGGDGPHHVDGRGGLRNPGIMTADADGNVYVPEAGTVDASGQAGHGRVLKIDARSVPATPADCPGELPKAPVKADTFITDAEVPFPLGVAHDPSCDCFAVSNAFGTTAIRWYGKDGRPADRPSVPGQSGADGYNPFGLAFAPDGTLFFVDIHVQCNAKGCGPTDHGGNLYRVTFGPGRAPSAPEKLATGMEFPVGVTTCDGRTRVCPVPTKDHGPPLRVSGGAGE